MLHPLRIPGATIHTSYQGSNAGCKLNVHSRELTDEAAEQCRAKPAP